MASTWTEYNGHQLFVYVRGRLVLVRWPSHRYAYLMQSFGPPELLKETT